MFELIFKNARTVNIAVWGYIYLPHHVLVTMSSILSLFHTSSCKVHFAATKMCSCKSRVVTAETWPLALSNMLQTLPFCVEQTAASFASWHCANCCKLDLLALCKNAANLASWRYADYCKLGPSALCKLLQIWPPGIVQTAANLVPWRCANCCRFGLWALCKLLRTWSLSIVQTATNFSPRRCANSCKLGHWSCANLTLWSCANCCKLCSLALCKLLQSLAPLELCKLLQTWSLDIVQTAANFASCHRAN